MERGGEEEEEEEVVVVGGGGAEGKGVWKWTEKTKQKKQTQTH